MAPGAPARLSAHVSELPLACLPGGSIRTSVWLVRSGFGPVPSGFGPSAVASDPSAAASAPFAADSARLQRGRFACSGFRSDRTLAGRSTAAPGSCARRPEDPHWRREDLRRRSGRCGSLGALAGAPTPFAGGSDPSHAHPVRSRSTSPFAGASGPPARALEPICASTRPPWSGCFRALGRQDSLPESPGAAAPSARHVMRRAEWPRKKGSRWRAW